MDQASTKDILQYLSAFWWNTGIYTRSSDYSQKKIISSFPSDCPYPVWHKDEWMEHANPPSGQYDSVKDFFPQLWEVFKSSPIPHNIGIGNENCEYADDAWYSKNCYLSHSFIHSEDCRYMYRCIRLKDCYFCVYCFDCSKSIDLMYCFDCYNTIFAIDSKRCKNSTFLYDCQDCEDCLLCWNLRNKRYCIGNKQYSKEQYLEERKKYNLNSRKVYKKLEEQFSEYVRTHAYWKHLQLESTQNSTGNYLKNVKNLKNCFFVEESEDCENLARCHAVKSVKNGISILKSEKVENCSIVQIDCYNVANSYNITQSKNIDYCAHCYNCENCFGCCGLVGKKYHIFNKPYSEQEYEVEKQKIISDLKGKNVYGQFFPAYFSATPYDDSLAALNIPLSHKQQKQQGYFISKDNVLKGSGYKDISDLPDIINENSIGSYGNETGQRPFQVTKEDISFYKKIGIPTHQEFYISRIKRNCWWMFSGFELRETTCSKSGEKILTALPEILDSRIVSMDAYNGLIL